MLMIRGVGGARKAVVIGACIIAPLFLLFVLRHGSSDGASCQIFASREVMNYNNYLSMKSILGTVLCE